MVLRRWFDATPPASSTWTLSNIGLMIHVAMLTQNCATTEEKKTDKVAKIAEAGIQQNTCHLVWADKAMDFPIYQKHWIEFSRNTQSWQCWHFCIV